MILTDSCERHQSRLGELFGRLAVVSVIACVLHGNFDTNFIQCLCWDSRRKFINQSFAVSQFRFENLAAHRLPGNFEEFSDRHNLYFLVELSPKNLQWIF